ncbi:MAG: hypothetical protein K6B28_13525 [Lachnospiraceae bacterium]|nr:hypothetical protein [Lachnospiraceae bacterium]
MIRFCKKLFLTEKTERDLEKIRQKLYTGAGMTGIIFIELASNKKDVFDLIPAAMFKQKSFRSRDHFIIGIAENRRKCNDLVKDIVLEHFEATGSYENLRKDIEDRIVG